jgi:phosphoglycerol transferase MdoB-like AlkP superfamily enzyme
MAVPINFFKQIRVVFLSIVLLLVFYFGLRIIFFAYNRALFPGISTREWLQILGWGLKMDLSAIAWLNLPVFGFYFLGCYFPKKKEILSQLLRILFVLVNMTGLAINVLDIAYFRYRKQRSNIDLWFVWSDSMVSVKSMVTGFWPLIILLLLLAAALVYFAKKIIRIQPVYFKRSNLIFYHCLILAFLLILARGWEGRPLIPASPLLQLDARQLPLAQNSIGSFLYSVIRRQEQLVPKHYYSQAELNNIVSTRHILGAGGSAQDTMLKKNVLVCILESFSRCYLSPGDPKKATTPFFDSLIEKSIYFPNAYANAFESNQGIVAILGGLPALMDEPFYYSSYANTPLDGLGNILKSKGWNTNFFLGAGRDHFGFGKFTAMAGIDNYYSRVDFNEDRFFDGNWGIFDDPFLQYGAGVLSRKQQPFLAVIYNISSHPPFTIPASLRQQFNFPGKTPAQRSISYVDYSFRHFFETCEKAPWFHNTVFVFCADHGLYPEDDSGINYINNASIPIFIFDPSRKQGTVDTSLISQVDLTPTVLDLLKYKGAFSGFGKSVFTNSTTQAYVINRQGYTQQITTKEFILGYDPSREKAQYLYHYTSDSLLKDNLIDNHQHKEIRKNLEYLLKANIQRYNQALISRSME